ncbi:undecaprenyldiphospho-muramoylpentapeptide beta-N-acetylglucosaminyltransferase [Halalkalibacter sp. APA_J-10(15)]|uniref:undecaprenyldiphospho-muramoylpentapeptide beta-N-acetylglucosaminyltransferase n=1 Tax=Halalkalibacter sp. APA_J-10(15) TaxID=2933805 RepID=UPI001FF3B9C0|nr:undecaprenyldiphospho-muramoylpentapeptide beta-N-acetylglucosaminyltransferase [Halalkalibacter sp. APA_J-10(15)]MCK0473051.1 undecaprenyldiphospho-muramoylpentapeptide beta-N-acetylglucosaminyltransferase [Halalkalibacter sp. APA_J-10(15)]
MVKRSVVFTGGGSAGHVTPNIAIIKEINNQDWEINYIGSKSGIEKDLITKLNIPYHPINSGKLRRYVDFENVIDIFRVFRGCKEARSILKKIKPDLVFSKGGFVTVPVIVAAKTLKIPVFIHESDITPGLANKISKRFATKIFTTFAETKQFFPEHKTKVVGSPIRREILNGSIKIGKRYLGFNDFKPVLTIMGGSLGAKKINDLIRDNLDLLLQNYQIVHLCGKNNIDKSLIHLNNYKQFEYVNEELSDILAATDFVITRGGSNAIFEFLALRIPMIIIPLGLEQSRGDQILNAKSFEEKGYSITVNEQDLSADKLQESLAYLLKNKHKIRENMRTASQFNAISILVKEMTDIIQS